MNPERYWKPVQGLQDQSDMIKFACTSNQTSGTIHDMLQSRDMQLWKPHENTIAVIYSRRDQCMNCNAQGPQSRIPPESAKSEKLEVGSFAN